MSRARDKSQAQASHIRTLIGVLAGMVLILAVVFALLFYSMRDIRAWIPPDITEGGRLQFNTVPKVVLYEFTLKIWGKLNFWETDGADDYSANIALYRNYLTPACRTQLMRDYQRAMAKGEVQKRRRTIREYNTFVPGKVVSTGSGTWKVSLDVHLTETVRDSVVKDISINYPLRLVSYDIDQDANPWGLAIDCFHADPTLIEDNLVSQQ